MTTRISNTRASPASTRTSTKAPAAKAAKHAAFLRDEMSTGKGRAHRSSAQRAVGSGAGSTSGQNVQRAFEQKIAALQRAIANGVPGAKEELAAVVRDRDGVQAAISDVEQKIAANENPETWANVTPRSRAQAEQADARAQLKKQLTDLKTFGLKVAKMNPKERQDLQNFFRLAKEDPEAFKQFVDAHTPGANGAAPAGPVNTSPTQAPANIQAAIDFGLSQQGAPYVGGASPFRFGQPGNGQSYRMEGQNSYVSPKGVVGYDCSGLMVTMLKKAGIDISNLASSRAMKANLPQVPKDQLQPGDLLVKNGHVAMYIGDGKMIESVPAGVQVVSASKYINDPAYSGHRAG
ncbi:MAG: NlpC/P60 family protein [Myxococcales bacterium]|nr:NlpC/P60 family protein [Myxococcales bacterium]